jgi:hypothetical protein
MGIETPKLILGGDKQKALGWLGFARNKLRQLKAIQEQGITGVSGVLGVSAIINQMYRPINGTKILLKSFDGHDYINIFVEQVGGCILKVSSQDLGGNEVRLTTNYTFAGSTDDRGWGLHVQWGDGNESLGFTTQLGADINMTHEYASGGEKNISIKAWNLKPLKSGLAASAPSTATGYIKTLPYDGAQSDTPSRHAATLASPWAEIDLSTRPYPSSDIGLDRCYYTSRNLKQTVAHWEFGKTIVNVDLTGESLGKMFGFLRWNFFSSFIDPLHRPGIYRNGQLWYTLHENITPGFTNTRDMGNLSVTEEIEFKDIGDYTYPAGHIPGFPPIHSGTQYFQVWWGGFDAIFYAYDCYQSSKITITLE